MQEIKMRMPIFKLHIDITLLLSTGFYSISVVYSPVDSILKKVRKLQTCRQHSSPVDRHAAYQSILVSLRVVFWVRFEFQFILFLFFILVS